MAEMKIDISDVVNSAIENIKQKGYTVQKWIPYSDKRPDLWGEYLTYNAENGAMYVLSFSPADNTFGIYDGNVTHWMSLPEPPESEVHRDAKTKP